MRINNLKKKSTILISLLLSANIVIAIPPIERILSTNQSSFAVATIPIFTIASTPHGTTDSITFIHIAGCTSAESSFSNCQSNPGYDSFTSNGSFSINPGDTISISIPAIAQPLHFWQTLTSPAQYAAVHIENSATTGCDTAVVAYTCPTSTTCSSLSFSPLVSCAF